MFCIQHVGLLLKLANVIRYRYKGIVLVWFERNVCLRQNITKLFDLLSDALGSLLFPQVTISLSTLGVAAFILAYGIETIASH